MPYEIRNNCVYKKNAKKPLKCYDNHKQALAYLRALEANVDDAKTYDDVRKMFSLPSQQETNYSPAGQQGNKACSSCRFYLREGWDGAPSCHLIDNWPEPIEPNGLCDRHEFATPPEETIVPVPVVIVEPDMLEDDSAMMSLSVPKTLVQRVKDFIAGLRPRATDEPAGFKVFKTANGKMAWIARYTGKYIDREQEILADQAHADYAQRVQAGDVPMPELWMWHAKGTRHGEAVYVWKAGGFMCAAGYLDDNAVGKRAFEYYKKNAGKIKLSHMFYFPPEAKIDGVYTKYTFTKEITTLPDGAEAFPYTSFQELDTMTIPQAGQTMISDGLGPEVLQAALELDGKSVGDTKVMDASGVAFKGGIEPAPAPETAKVTPAEPSPELKLLQDSMVQMAATLKQVSDQLLIEQQAKADLLKQFNDMQSKVALLTDLQPPASKSNETLLNEREKTLVDSVMETAKSADQKSLIETLMGGQPFIQS